MTTALWVLMNLFVAVDYGQSRMIVKNPSLYHEHSMVLPEHPTMGQMNMWLAGSLLFHNGVMLALPKEYRVYYAGGVVAAEGVTIQRNHSIGLRVEF